MKSLKVVLIIGVLAVLGLGGCVVFLFMGNIAGAIILFVGSVAPLILAAVFGYPQYQSVMEAKIPIASVEFEKKGEGIPRHFEAKIGNNCPQAIQAQYNLIVSMWGHIKEFPSGETQGTLVVNPNERRTACKINIARIIIDHMPYSSGQSKQEDESDPDHAITRLEVEAKRKPNQADNILRFKMTVNYFGLSSKKEGKPIINQYYYDFKNKKLADLFPPVA